MKTLSLCMIVKNEEAHLTRCLDSAKQIVDEIVVVDTGSTDSTKNIAESYNAKVFDFNWINDFSAARNFALSKCTSDFILYLDADEYIIENSENSFRKILEQESLKSYKCRIVNIDTTNGRPSVMNYVRLFPRVAGIEFTGAVHEQVEPSIVKNKIPIVNSEIEIVHTGYDSASHDLKDKAKRNLGILLTEFNSNKSSYVSYQLGQTYHLIEQDENAEKYFNLAIRDSDLNKEYLSTAYRFLAVRSLERMQLAEAEEQIHNSLLCDKNQPLAHLVYAQILSRLGNKKNALSSIQAALEANEFSRSADYRSEQNILLDNYTIVVQGLIASLNGNENDAFNQFAEKLKSIKQKSSFKKSINILIRIIAGKKITRADIKEILDVVQDDDLALFIKLAPLINERKEIRKFYRHLEEKFKNNIYLLREHGIYLMNENLLEDADKKFESVLLLTTKDPSIYFYRVSIALKQNNINQVRLLVSQLDTNFKNNSSVLPQINNLKQKLAQFI